MLSKVLHSEYEFFLKSGVSFLITEVEDLIVTHENKKITGLEILGSDTTDKLIFINIEDIDCIIKRKSKKVLKWTK